MFFPLWVSWLKSSGVCLCSKPPTPVIRLGEIAKRLPSAIRHAVADVLAYDPPSPHSQPGPQPQEEVLPPPCCTQTAEVAQPLSTTQPDLTSEALLATDRLPGALPTHGVLNKAGLGGMRQIPLPAAQHAKHGSGGESALPAWRNPADLTSREIALEQLLAVKISQPVPAQQSTTTSSSSSSGAGLNQQLSQHVPAQQGVVRDMGHARGDGGRGRSAVPSRKGAGKVLSAAPAAPASAAVPGLSLAAVMQHADQDANHGEQALLQ